MVVALITVMLMVQVKFTLQMNEYKLGKWLFGKIITMHDQAIISTHPDF
jgi:hypothetical protein